VYWANLCPLPSEIVAPTSLLKNLSDSQSEQKGDNWLSCPSINTRHKNTFMTTFPQDIWVDFEKMQRSHDYIVQRKAMYKNSFAFDFNIEIIISSISNTGTITLPTTTGTLALQADVTTVSNLVVGLEIAVIMAAF